MDENSESTSAIYAARIDGEGNYYARYSRKGINSSDREMRSYDVCTSADAVHNFNDMKFLALGQNKEILSVSPEDDEYQRKRIRINFKEPVKKGDVYSFEYRFMWKSTIGLYTGDTDHFWIGDCRHVSICLTFPHELLTPRFYLVKDKNIIDELRLLRREEANESVTYFMEFDNEDENDGIIFYFDGQDSDMSIDGISYLSSPEIVNSKNGEKFSIRRCNEDDIRDIYKIEQIIEKSNAATESVLYERMKLFPEGFIVIKNPDKEVVGYLESIIWHDFKFCKFEDICDFPLHFSPYGDTLYVIFVAIHPKWRGKYLGLNLVQTIVEFARRYGGIDKIKLVAKDKRIGLYQKCGFDFVKELPRFLEDRGGTNIVMKNDLKS